MNAAVRALSLIVEEAQTAWPTVRLGIHHRIGRLDIGEASVIIAAASPHRADAFAACRYAIERVKQIVPIWKREHFEGGEVWLEGATQHEGSWWPEWHAWVSAHGDGTVPARDPGKGPLKPVEDAPGSYVRVKSTA